MDYIVFGTGYGATLLLLGWAFRTFGPGLRYPDAGEDAPASAEVLVRRVAWTRFAEALGAVVATAGAAIILVTFITALINPGNRPGAIALWVSFALVVTGAAVWLWLYVARYGADGLVPERLDIARLFERRKQAPVLQAGPEPAFAAHDPDPGYPDSLVAHDADFDEDDFDPVIHEEFDDLVPVPGMEDDVEMTVHTSRYQAHHPDDEDDEPDDAYHSLFSMYGVEESPADAADETVDQPVNINESELAVEPEEAPAEDAEPVESVPDVEAATDAPDGSDDDPDPESIAVGDDSAVDGPEEDADQPDATAADEPEPDAPLADTPEGRAEALRRIQEWHPGEDVS